MNNSMVAHLWAHEQEESASGSNFFFEGTSIYSYGHHFEVGRIVKNKQGKKAYLINEDYYSATTSKHQCYTFKDGEVLSNKDGSYIFILNTHGKYLTSFYASLNQKGILKIEDGLSAWENQIEKYRFATESERQKLVDALKASKEPKAKEYLKRFFGIEEKPKYDFKPFDKVLVRDEDDKEWHISLFAREIVDDSDGLSYKHECSNGTLWDCCIPFEGNEYLLGTAENPEE